MLLGQSTSGQRAGAQVPGFTFGRFRIDPDRGELLRDGAPVALRPKSYEVLLHLVARAGTVVSRDELFDAVWPGLVVTDDSLTQCLTEIRKALGDEKREIIRTVLRRGYIFQAEVEAVTPDLSEPPMLTRGSESSQGRLPSRWTLAGLLVLALALAATWFRFETQPRLSDRPAADWQPPPASVAVLPFVDMSEAGDQEYLGDGIAEEILNLLAQSPGLTVIARTSSFAFKDDSADIATIARRLDVAHVLEGSVRKAGDRVRVTAQLVNGATGVHVWSETYDDRLQDAFTLQDRIARSVAGVLQVRLVDASAGDSASRHDAHQPDPAAWELYMRGRLYYSRRADWDRTRALRNFEEALEIDANFAAAWVGLSAALSILVDDAGLPEAERLSWDVAAPRIRDALQRALELDPDNPEALMRMAYLKLADFEMEQSLALMGRAARLGGNNAMLQSMLGGSAFMAGQPDMAERFLRRAVVLDPVSAVHQFNFAHSLFATGRFEEARAALQRAGELSPGVLPAQGDEFIWSHIHEGNLDVAEELLVQIPTGPFRDQVEAIVRFRQGHKAAADEALSRLTAYPPFEVAGRLAEVYAVRGEVDRAFRWLSVAADAIVDDELGFWRREELTFLEHSPFLAPLRHDARWSPWLTKARAQLRGTYDQRVIAMLQSHLDAHPKLYAAGGRTPTATR